MKFNEIITNNINFLYSQNGRNEREFKQKIMPLLWSKKEIEKAYLVAVQYTDSNENNVAICIKSSKIDEQEIVNKINKVFRNMFSKTQCLDIIFINDMHENKIKSICLPFFNRETQKSNSPDFYLTFTEGFDKQKPKSCWCIKQLSYGHRDDLILVDIKPSLIYQDTKEGEIMLDQVVLAGRHEGYPIFPLKNWPIYVYVVRIINPIDKISFELKKEDIENIAWGELYSEVKFSK